MVNAELERDERLCKGLRRGPRLHNILIDANMQTVEHEFVDPEFKSKEKALPLVANYFAQTRLEPRLICVC